MPTDNEEVLNFIDMQLSELIELQKTKERHIKLLNECLSLFDMMFLDDPIVDKVRKELKGLAS